MSGRIWSLGVFLVALGIAAQVVGWDALLRLPRVAMDWLAWIPHAVAEAVAEAPLAWTVVALGVVLMVAARLIARRGG